MNSGLFALVLLTAGAIAQGIQTYSCGNTPDADIVEEYEKRFKEILGNITLVPRGAGGSLAARAVAVIPVYFHVVRANTTLAGGDVPVPQIVAQIAQLNADYSGTNVSFILAGVDSTTNAAWFTNAGPGSTEQTQMKQALRQGGVDALNVYTVGFQTNPGLLGYATFPSSYASNPQDDGVVILYSTTPGGSMVDYNLGRVLTHETGHWVGLYHTFQGFPNGCFPFGDDQVSDTPAEASPAYGFPVGRDSCIFVPGLDLIRNYMDYTNDACKNNFTPRQGVRLRNQLTAFRGITF